MASSTLYRGFNSFQYEKTHTFALNDIELVESDIINHIYTRKGERVKMPTYGTRIPDLLFDPLTPQLVDIVTEDLLGVIEQDPRVSLVTIDVVPIYDKNTLGVLLTLNYVELNKTFDLSLNLDFATST